MPGSRRSRLTLQRMFAFLANGYSTLQETCRVTTKVRSHFATACLIDRSGAADTHGSRRFVLCRRKLQAASCLVARHPRDKLPRVGWPFRAPFRAVRRGRRTKSTVTFNDDLTATMSAQASRSHRYVMNCFNRPTGRPGRASYGQSTPGRTRTCDENAWECLSLSPKRRRIGRIFLRLSRDGRRFGDRH